MCDAKDQEFQDLKEFLGMLDFDVKDDTVYIIPNEFKFDELPATVQSFITSYLDYIKTIS